MRVVLGSDHAGFEMKLKMLDHVRALGHEAVDVGAHNDSPSDYPDYAEALALAILNNNAERGILICGSGVGASMAANKIPGVRAGLCHEGCPLCASANLRPSFSAGGFCPESCWLALHFSPAFCCAGSSVVTGR